MYREPVSVKFATDECQKHETRNMYRLDTIPPDTIACAIKGKYSHLIGKVAFQQNDLLLVWSHLTEWILPQPGYLITWIHTLYKHIFSFHVDEAITQSHRSYEPVSIKFAWH